MEYSKNFWIHQSVLRENIPDLLRQLENAFIETSHKDLQIYKDITDREQCFDNFSILRSKLQRNEESIFNKIVRALRLISYSGKLYIKPEQKEDKYYINYEPLFLSFTNMIYNIDTHTKWIILFGITAFLKNLINDKDYTIESIDIPDQGSIHYIWITSSDLGDNMSQGYFMALRSRSITLNEYEENRENKNRLLLEEIIGTEQIKEKRERQKTLENITYDIQEPTNSQVYLWDEKLKERVINICTELREKKRVRQNRKLTYTIAEELGVPIYDNEHKKISAELVCKKIIEMIHGQKN